MKGNELVIAMTFEPSLTVIWICFTGGLSDPDPGSEKLLNRPIVKFLTQIVAQHQVPQDFNLIFRFSNSNS